MRRRTSETQTPEALEGGVPALADENDVNFAAQGVRECRDRLTQALAAGESTGSIRADLATLVTRHAAALASIEDAATRARAAARDRVVDIASQQQRIAADRVRRTLDGLALPGSIPERP